MVASRVTPPPRSSAISQKSTIPPQTRQRRKLMALHARCSQRLAEQTRNQRAIGHAAGEWNHDTLRANLLTLSLPGQAPETTATSRRPIGADRWDLRSALDFLPSECIQRPANTVPKIFHCHMGIIERLCTGRLDPIKSLRSAVPNRRAKPEAGSDQPLTLPAVRVWRALRRRRLHAPIAPALPAESRGRRRRLAT